MSKLDEILYKRLEKIREELNSYIDLRLSRGDGILSTPITDGAPEEKEKGGVLEKFLSYMKLNDDDYEDSDSVNPSVKVKIPDFLTKGEKQLNLDAVLAKREESFSEMLLRVIDEKGLKDSDVYKRANIDRRLFSKIRGNEDYSPSKKTAISFCLALQLELDEAKKLLATAGYTLSASSRFDLIIMYLIENCEYNVHFANIVLEDYGEGTLSR